MKIIIAQLFGIGAMISLFSIYQQSSRKKLIICKLCADICRDCGESSLASGIEGAGRIAIISLCIPVIGELMRLALKILEMGE